jgi:pSer/pThr/pTyr-binding forkhead associated (FHA) protein
MSPPQLIIHDTESIKTLTLSGMTIWTFGRSKENTVQIQDLMASRIHAQIEIHQNDQYVFVDLDSRNGTLINDEPIIKPHLLKNGDRICIGNTVLVFEQGVESRLEKDSSGSSKKVFMLHASAAQTAFWQEILAFRGVSIVKEISVPEFKKQIDLDAASDLENLSKVLLMDVRAYDGDCYQLCRWIRQKYPQYKIFLTDSKRRTLSVLERHVAIKNGALNQFPAMSRRDLVLNSAEVLRQVNEVFQVLDSPLIDKKELLFILRTNEVLKDWHSSENSTIHEFA